MLIRQWNFSYGAIFFFNLSLAFIFLLNKEHRKMLFLKKLKIFIKKKKTFTNKLFCFYGV